MPPSKAELDKMSIWQRLGITATILYICNETQQRSKTIANYYNRIRKRLRPRRLINVTKRNSAFSYYETTKATRPQASSACVRVCLLRFPSWIRRHGIGIESRDLSSRKGPEERKLHLIKLLINEGVGGGGIARSNGTLKRNV